MISSRVTLLLALLCVAARAGALSPLPRDHIKVVTATAVFDELVAAVGDGRTAPALRLLPPGEGGELQALWYDGERHAILLEESAYDALTVGADSLDALAFVLGHELAHYYKDHRWTADFSAEIRDLALGRALQGLGNSRRKRTEIEAEADFFGGFYAHMAGYDALGAAPEALGRIYERFGLRDASTEYPSLADRRSLAHQAAGRLAQQVPVFEAGVHLLLLGQHEEAARCFDFIARTFPSREILNNAGVARALEALALFPAGEILFAYPLELDAQTRLASGRKADRPGFGFAAHERRLRFLAQATKALETACARDRNFATARVNLACVADLRGDPEQALLHARKAISLAQQSGEPVSLANAYLIQGIARAHLRPADTEGAGRDFGAAMTGNPELAAINYTVLQDGRASVVVSTKGARRASVGGLTNADIDVTVRSADTQSTVPAVDDGETDLVVYSRSSANGNYIVIDTGYQTIALRMNGTGETGLQRGGDAAQLLQRLGGAQRLIAARQGTWHVYEEAGLLVQIRAAAIRNWTTFLIQ